MNEDSTTEKRPLKRFRRFSLSFLMLLMTLFALGTIYVNFHRERGNDALHQTLAEIAKIEVLQSPKQVVSWRDRLMGNSDPRQIGNTVSFDTRLLEHEINIDRMVASRLARNLNTGSIDELRFANVHIDSDAVCFFEDWEQVHTIQFRDTVLPKSWHDGIKRMAGLNELVISGGRCTLEPESLEGCRTLKKLTLCHRNVDAARLKQLKDLLPNVEILLLGSTDSAYPYPAGAVALSKHDPQAYASLKASLDRLKETLAALDPPAKNRFRPPATEAEIVQYEQYIGVPLHRSVRALFEIHNGQPNRIDELTVFEKLLSVDESMGNMDMEISAAMVLEEMYNFDPDYDWMNNPNLIGIGSSEADVLYVNNVSGKVYTSYEGLYYAFPKLENYFDAIRNEVEAGRFSRNEHDCIRLTESTSSIWKKSQKRQQESQPR